MIKISSFYAAFDILFYGSVSVAGFGILFHHNTGRGHFSFLHQNSRSFEFGAGGKSHNSVFIHLAKPKRQTLTGDALFLFVGGRNRVYGRCGSSLQEKRKKHQQHQFCEEYRDIDLDLGSCKALCHECDILHEVKVSSRVPAN